MRKQRRGPAAPAPAEAQPSEHGERSIVGLLLIVTFLTFLSALGGEFVYDDVLQVLHNPTLQSPANIPRMFTQGVWGFADDGRQPGGLPTPHYRPLFNTALIVNHQLFGFQVIGWHLFSVLVHLLVTLGVYYLSREWGVRRRPSFWAALLFGVHPLHSESVAWVSGLPDPLSAALLVPALILYERHRRGGRAWRRLLVASTALALLAMLSKEVAVALPVFLVVREWFDRPPVEPLAALARRLVARTSFYWAAAAVYLAARYLALGALSRVSPESAGVSTAQVWLTIPSVLLGYARLLVFPFPLGVAYPQSYVGSAGDWRFWVAGLAAAGVLIGVVWLVKSSPPGRHALALLILFLLPVLNLRVFNQRESLMHDRYLYIPSIGFCLLLSLGWSRLDRRFARPGLIQMVIAGSFLILTARQNRFWRDEPTLFEQALRVGGRKAFFLHSLGSYYLRQQNHRQAERYFTAAVQADPAFPDSLFNLGEIYSSQARFAEAEAALTRGLDLRPADADARYNLAWVFDQQGKDALAEQAYRQVLQQNPSDAQSRANLAALLRRQGRYKDAMEILGKGQAR